MNSEQKARLPDGQAESSNEKLKLVVGWLYPHQMSTYGDRGNILTIYQRCLWRNIKIEIKEINLKETIDPTKIDLYFFGGGQDQAQKIVSEDLFKYKMESLRKASRLGAVILGICGGYQLLGHYYRPADSAELKGLGLLDIVTVAGNKRMIGNIVVELHPRLKFKNKETLVGFENHSGKTFLGKKVFPIGNVVVGYGNNGEDRTEGAYQGNTFGCYLHGPLLPKNPAFADLLIKKSLERRYGSVELEKLDDSIEIMAHESASKRAKETK